MRKYIFLSPAVFAFTIILGLLGNQSVKAQVDMNQAHSLFLYNFAKYSEFPSNANSNFKITILGSSSVYSNLKKTVSNRKIQGQTVLVKNVTSLKSLKNEISNTSILFISKSKSNLIHDIVKLTKGKSIMIITEKSGLHQKGACVSFIVQNSKLKFQVNTDTLSARHLKIAGAMLNFAHKG